MPILTAAEFPSVRRAIDPTLTERELPDSTIADEVYQTRAEDAVLARDPAAATRTDADQKRRVRLAAILFLAAELVTAVPTLRGRSIGRYSEQREVEPPAVRASRLRARAHGELDLLLGKSAAAAAGAALFTTAAGGRGR